MSAGRHMVTWHSLLPQSFLFKGTCEPAGHAPHIMSSWFLSRKALVALLKAD